MFAKKFKDLKNQIIEIHLVREAYIGMLVDVADDYIELQCYDINSRPSTKRLFPISTIQHVGYSGRPHKEILLKISLAKEYKKEEAVNHA